jgi:hypothetical protein
LISSSNSSKKSIGKLEKKFKSVAKQFAQIKSQMEGRDKSDKDNDDDEQSHFQFTHYPLANQNVSPEKTHADVSMKQTKGKLDDLNLCEVILLNNKSTMSLFCDKRMVTNI